MLDLKGNRITYFGHSTFSLTTPAGEVALVDPWVMTNPVCPQALRHVPRLETIFLTHAHGDHLGDLLALAATHHPKIVCSFETSLWLTDKGFGDDVRPMGKGGTQRVGPFSVTMTHAMHSNSIDDNGVRIYGGEPAGFVITMPGDVRVYHAGDTALFGDMRLIAELYSPHVAILPIGDLYTMGPREAALAVRLLGARHVIPMHYGTFPALTGTAEEFRSLTDSVGGVTVHTLRAGYSVGD